MCYGRGVGGGVGWSEGVRRGGGGGGGPWEGHVEMVGEGRAWRKGGRSEGGPGSEGVVDGMSWQFERGKLLRGVLKMNDCVQREAEETGGRVGGEGGVGGCWRAVGRREDGGRGGDS